MTKPKRRMLCCLAAAILLAAVTAVATGLSLWADRQYSARLAQETAIRFQDGVLLDRELAPLSPEDSVILFQQATSAVQPLVLSTLPEPSSAKAELLIPYLPDYGSDLGLSTTAAGQWQLFYRTLDGLEVTARYALSGVEGLDIYLPQPDLEVRLTGVAPAQVDYTPHARRPVTPVQLWAALTAQIS